MKDSIAKFNDLCKKALGSDYVGFIDQADTARQVAVCTNEPACLMAMKWVDAVSQAAQEAGFRPCVLPYSVNGKMIYVLAVSMCRAA